MSNINDIKKQLESLQKSLGNPRLSSKEKQEILDQISDKKRTIENISKKSKLVVPIVGAKTIGERKNTRASAFNGNRVRI